MPNDINWDDEDQDTNYDDSAPIDDNKTIKALRNKIKADETKFASQATQLEGLLQKERERTVKEILEKKGANPSVARLALKDLGEVTDENVDAWLIENAEALNLKVAPPASVEGTENFDELSNQDAFTQQANSPGTGGTAKAKIDSFKTFEEINAWANSQQQ